jgi:hypothetical protein
LIVDVHVGSRLVVVVGHDVSIGLRGRRGRLLLMAA